MTDGTKVYSITKILEMVLSDAKLKLLPHGPIRLVIGGDSGGDGRRKTVKIGFFFADLPNGRSPHNFFVLSIKRGDDGYRNISEILNLINKDVNSLSNTGIIINGKKLSVEL